MVAASMPPVASREASAPPHGRRPAEARRGIPDRAQVGAEARPGLRVEERHELVRERFAHDAAPPTARPVAQELQLQQWVGRFGGRVAPRALVGDHDLAVGSDDRDVEGAHRDGDLAGGHLRAGRVAMLPAGFEASLLVALACGPCHAREGRWGQGRERLPVVFEKVRFGGVLAVVGLALGCLQARLEEPLVVAFHVEELGHGHEQVAPERPDLVLRRALLVARAGVGEAVVQPVVRGEATEQHGGGYVRADATPDLGGVVEDGAQGHAAQELEHVSQPLADALGRLVPEHLSKPDVGVRERDHEEVAARDHPSHAEVGLAEVHLALAGRPVEQQEPLRLPGIELSCDLGAPAPHVPAHRRVRTREALLLDEPVVDPLGCVPLLVPAAPVLGKPRVD